jgi:hypothetical protein
MEIKNIQTPMDDPFWFPGELNSSLEEPRARASVSQESERDLTEPADLQEPLSSYLKVCTPGGSSGKMSRGVYPPGISKPEYMTSTFFLQPLQKSGILAGGEFLTLNTCEWTDTLVPFLSVDGVCSLSDILEQSGNIPQKYYLSPTACLGILRRAESRGKALPPMLKNALEWQAGILLPALSF